MVSTSGISTGAQLNVSGTQAQARGVQPVEKQFTEAELDMLKNNINSNSQLTDENKALLTGLIDKINDYPQSADGNLDSTQQAEVMQFVQQSNASEEMKGIVSKALKVELGSQTEDTNTVDQATPSSRPKASSQKASENVNFTPPKKKTLFQRLFKVVDDAMNSVSKAFGLDYSKTKKHSSADMPPVARKFPQPTAPSQEVEPPTQPQANSQEVDTEVASQDAQQGETSSPEETVVVPTTLRPSPDGARETEENP